MSETTHQHLLEQRCDDAKAAAVHPAHEWTVSTLTYWCLGYPPPRLPVPRR